MSKKKMTMGLIVGNRGFFPDHLANSGREEVTAVLQKAGMDVVVLSPQESKCGAVTTREDVHRCVELFKKNRDSIDGIIVTLPNFGEERAIADSKLELACDTAEPAEHLLEYYARHGFRVVERHRWPHARYDTVVLSKRLAT